MARPKPRATGFEQYRIRFFLVVEGETEVEYFNTFSPPTATVSMTCITPDKGSDPDKVLKTLKRIINKGRADKTLRSGDPAWAVIDRDNWSEQQIEALFKWAYDNNRKDRGIAFTDPQFEFWLLLHYCDGSNAATKKDCLSRLNEFIPNYDKNNSKLPSSPELKHKAVENACRRLIDNPEPQSLADLKDTPRGLTTVHLLVEKLLKLEEGNFNI